MTTNRKGSYSCKCKIELTLLVLEKEGCQMISGLIEATVIVQNRYRHPLVIGTAIGVTLIVVVLRVAHEVQNKCPRVTDSLTLLGKVVTRKGVMRNMNQNLLRIKMFLTVRRRKTYCN